MPPFLPCGRCRPPPLYLFFPKASPVSVVFSFCATLKQLLTGLVCIFSFFCPFAPLAFEVFPPTIPSFIHLFSGVPPPPLLVPLVPPVLLPPPHHFPRTVMPRLRFTWPPSPPLAVLIPLPFVPIELRCDQGYSFLWQYALPAFYSPPPKEALTRPLAGFCPSTLCPGNLSPPPQRQHLFSDKQQELGAV